MRRIVSIAAICACWAPAASAEILKTEPACAYSVAHEPDADIAAEDLNGSINLPPLELQLRRDIPVRSAWFLEAALGAIRLDLHTGAAAGQGGLDLSTAPDTGCD
jgi:hypothetical protein